MEPVTSTSIAFGPVPGLAVQPAPAPSSRNALASAASAKVARSLFRLPRFISCVTTGSETRPRQMNATRSQVRSTSSNTCEESSTAAPRSRSSATSSSKRACMSGSRPLVGSSSSSTRGAPMNALTMATFCLVPLDMDPMRAEVSSSKRASSARLLPGSSMPRSSAM